MKLLYCQNCDCVFKLAVQEMRQCYCGQVKGWYINSTNAVVNGKGFSLAIGNGSFVQALSQVYTGKINADWRADPGWTEWWNNRPENSGLFLAWARPHEDVANSHTKVDHQL